MYNSFDDSGLVKVLNFLKTHNTEYLSGQDLSDVLKISRVAVWKHIKKIQELGYEVESKKKRGYRLKTNSDKLLPWEITTGLKTKNIGQRAYYYDSIDSTQKEAIRLSELDNNDGIIIVAAIQTEGKGRSGRKWISPNGGIWFSIILHPKFDISITTLFPIASAVAIAKAIEKTFNITPELKWPNDLTIQGKKLAGIIVDANFESNKIENLILGVGINFEVNVKSVEKTLKNTGNFYGVASLSNQHKKVKRVRLIQVLLQELEKIYELLNTGRKNRIISDWTKRSSTIGKKIKVNTAKGEVKGRAIKIDNEGALVISLENDAKIERIVAGDIIHL